MKLQCSNCGRKVGAGRYYRRGDTCGAWIVLREARIFKADGRLVFLNSVRNRCMGTLE